MVSRALLLSVLVALLAAALPSANAFVTPSAVASTRSSTTPAFVFGKKKPAEDFSDIETRDMTREEMVALNEQNEEVMNMELSMMTGFSLVISLPILYLCWVAFFSD
jgi:selenocysteine-specific elongation factor